MGGHRHLGVNLFFYFTLKGGKQSILTEICEKMDNPLKGQEKSLKK
jgi:hypothetical protein